MVSVCRHRPRKISTPGSTLSISLHTGSPPIALVNSVNTPSLNSVYGVLNLQFNKHIRWPAQGIVSVVVFWATITQDVM